MKRNKLPYVLYKNIDIVRPYAIRVEPVKEMINITAFCPGGRGLWLEDSTDKFPSILVLGQDFSTVKQYEKMLEGKASDLESPTWRNSNVKRRVYGNYSGHEAEVEMLKEIVKCI